jgi:hypothetical protein
MLLAHHTAYLHRLGQLPGVNGTSRSARRHRELLAIEAAQNHDQQAVVALAQAWQTTDDSERTTEFRRARDFADQATEIWSETCQAMKRRTGVSWWIGLNLRRWSSLRHTDGVADPDQLKRSHDEIAAIIGERHRDLRTDNLGVLLGARFRWSRRLPGTAREKALHYLAADYLALGLISRQLGEPRPALDHLQIAWRLAQDRKVRNEHPIAYAVTAAVTLLTASSVKDVLPGAKKLAADSVLQGAARKLLLTQNHHWRFSRIQNVQALRGELDALGIL